MFEALEQLDLAYQLGPNEQFIVNLMDAVHYALPEALVKDNDQYTFLWLTATPTAKPTMIPSPTGISAEDDIPATFTPSGAVVPSATAPPLPNPSNTPIEEDTTTTTSSSEKSPLQICPAFLLPFFLILLVRKKNI
jgi:hypothetical protein